MVLILKLEPVIQLKGRIIGGKNAVLQGPALSWKEVVLNHWTGSIWDPWLLTLRELITKYFISKQKQEH